jgi:hypothetical protein
MWFIKLLLGCAAISEKTQQGLNNHTEHLLFAWLMVPASHTVAKLLIAQQ